MVRGCRPLTMEGCCDSTPILCKGGCPHCAHKSRSVVKLLSVLHLLRQSFRLQEISVCHTISSVSCYIRNRTPPKLPTPLRGDPPAPWLLPMPRLGSPGDCRRVVDLLQIVQLDAIALLDSVFPGLSLMPLATSPFWDVSHGGFGPILWAVQLLPTAANHYTRFPFVTNSARNGQS